MQDKDFLWFIENYMRIYEEYGNTFVAIKNQKIIGTYSSFAEGVRDISKKEELGTFIIQHCNGDVSGYTNYISSMNFLTT